MNSYQKLYLNFSNFVHQYKMFTDEEAVIFLINIYDSF
jgi:hypothetical protein